MNSIKARKIALFVAISAMAYFKNVYSQPAHVFGAMLSHHVAVPVYMTPCLKGRFQIAAGLFSLTMAFCAVYLGHHFVLDLIAGALLACFVGFMMQRDRAPRPTKSQGEWI